MTEHVKNVNVRLPADLWAALRDAASADARSLNSEIVVALREWLEKRTGRRR